MPDKNLDIYVATCIIVLAGKLSGSPKIMHFAKLFQNLMIRKVLSLQDASMEVHYNLAIIHHLIRFLPDDRSHNCHEL